MKNKRILLTGGAGFIGSTLAERLIGNNEILIYDNFSRDSLKYKKLKTGDLKIICDDVLNFDSLRKACEDFKPEIVIHLAAIAGIDTVIIDPVKTLDVNINGTLNLLRALKKYSGKLERFLDFSTSEVLGAYAYKSNEKSQTNFAPVGEGRWTYSISKVTGEHLVHSFYKQHGYPCVTIRPFNIYGPGQVGEGAIQIFIKNVVKGKNIEIHGEGDQIRSWCYIDDMVDGIDLCLTNKKAVGEVINIGNPKGTITISSLAEKIVLLCKSKSKIVYIPKNYVDVELRIPSIDKAKDLLGFNPKVDLNEGIIRTYKWYSKNKDK
ncbi:MAG: NAD-dependent epimerase/dehydratase family protein [Ignavibacteria bacterium]|nr:NAD-dependent epimerase/dehydratase family protein [Ignavibacteria bacterium]MBK7158406.1 NAD-dependent epimerase/dehydratase family protein [Ignavibacteria bacterium]MBK7444803.1 NAD-dependent epimerase/dehydratase family protein [Ignavibacteria bacterium]MBK8383650.1 NAD-dependent epimerase/dehydratase family protein [Ignavibacteria bacterium]MBK9403476.1 NAD-dependent epimerase/dehydratase family protein [Ignavibacteria bacterium]